MRLDAWLAQEGVSKEEFADLAGKNLATVYRNIKGSVHPSRDTLEQTFVQTGGEVTPNDFFPLEEWRKQIPKDEIPE